MWRSNIQIITISYVVKWCDIQMQPCMSTHWLHTIFLIIFVVKQFQKIIFHMIYFCTFLCTLILQLHLDKYRTIYTLTVNHFILNTHLRTSNQLLQPVPLTSHAYMGIQALSRASPSGSWIYSLVSAQCI